MKQHLSSRDRKIRAFLGLVIVAVGAYCLLVNLWLGLFVLGVGIFTLYEGITRWTLVAALTEAWIRPDGGNMEVPGLKEKKSPAWEKAH